MKKRILSLLICIVMLISVMPLPVFAANQPAGMSEKFHITAADADLPDNDELFAGYVDKMFSGGTSTSAAYSGLAREKLTNEGQAVYDCLEPNIVSVANGETAYTTFLLDNAIISSNAKTTWTASELGYSSVTEEAIDAAFEAYWAQFDLDTVFFALLHDFPYELYWFDKTEGLYWWAYYDYDGGEIYISDLTFSFMVSEDYQSGSYDPDDPSVDTNLTGATSEAVTNAKAIVAEYADLDDDYSKLIAYYDTIIDLVDYNYDAINYDYAYGDPWQLVYVFDGDSSTDVVCEGYSKAFQYLCDLSEFDGNISCYSVTGLMDFVGGEGGAHMWNTVTMEDGKNYLVDVTNSEPGSVGESGEFLLAGASGSIEDGYIINAGGSDLYFLYDEDTVVTWGTDADSPLYLADESYSPHEHSYTDTVIAPTCTEDGYTIHRCDSCGESYIDNEVAALGHTEVIDEAVASTCTETGLTEGSHCSVCEEVLVEQEVVPLADHTAVIDEAVAPTCTETGLTEGSHCSVCGEVLVEQEVVPAAHSWDEGVVSVEPTEEADGELLYTCTVCGETKTEVIHTYTTVVTEPTCTEDGYTTYTCDICGETKVDDIVPAPGHSWSEWVTVKKPTEVEEGEEERICSVCGETETQPIARLENPFVDVSEESYYYEPVLWAVANGITTGVDETHFAPDNTCTRAQVVTFLWRAAGEPAPTSTDHPFTDIDADAYYYDAILWAVENGITTGMTETTFEPDGSCTRGQIVTFLWRAAGKPEPLHPEVPFTDLEADAYYYYPVLWALGNGITNGMTETTFEPHTICTRGQVVTFLYRANT